MSDKKLEELSALVDGEASELEVRRILNNIEQDQVLCQKWARYQLSSAVLKGETHGCAQQWSTMDLSARVALALESEPVLHAAADGRKRFSAALVKPFANVAVAASVSAAVILGWQSYSGQTMNVAGPVAMVTPGAASISGSMPVAAGGLMQVSQNSSGNARSVPVIPRQDIIRYNPEVDDQLNEYLISHSSNAAFNTASGMAPYARVVALKPSRSQAAAEK